MCYTCQAPKPQNPVFVSQSAEDTTEPGPVLALRGLDPSSVEAAVRIALPAQSLLLLLNLGRTAQIYGVLSEYAPIKEVRLVREKGTNISRGLCFVEFHSVEVRSLITAPSFMHALPSVVAHTVAVMSTGRHLRATQLSEAGATHRRLSGADGLCEEEPAG